METTPLTHIAMANNGTPQLFHYRDVNRSGGPDVVIDLDPGALLSLINGAQSAIKEMLVADTFRKADKLDEPGVCSPKTRDALHTAAAMLRAAGDFAEASRLDALACK